MLFVGLPALAQAGSTGQVAGFQIHAKFRDRVNASNCYRVVLYANINAVPRAVREDSWKRNGHRVRLWRQDKQGAIMLDPAAKLWWYAGDSERLNASQDAVAVLVPAPIGKVLSRTLLRTEDLLGRKTDHWRVVSISSGGKKETWDMWQDKRLNICLRATMESEKVYEVSEVKEGPQPGELFALPPDFRLRSQK
ncbi:MAG TPA: hypothetical protein VK638_06550 [Edaphobacter sp.]|nr:hypothetical protein [Edaphobacter sp.]